MKPITKYILVLLKRWNAKGYSPRSINTGSCMIFAGELKKRFSSGKKLWGDDCRSMFKTNVPRWGHCFFKYRGKFYDSEAKNGKLYPDDLPYYKRESSFHKRFKR